ncbi:type I polyketide synthase [Nocardia sp. XZ_19_385]|uniref:type I polyketide synthase n=1 Tax=Nocardia sp. XZ_19_385 TaxID=2769488 RepID=UPI00188E2AE9|nr:type I polyketide synthase [Nocardia sp. XZ_19_385]
MHRGQDRDYSVTDIAIVGMGCRFPGNVNGPGEFWQFLVSKGDGIVDMPADRWNTDLFYDPDPDAPGRMYTKRGGFLESPWDFDPEFFGISPREAVSMDPQQRLLLEVAWEALDDAGIAGRVGGRQVGVYAGGFMVDNLVRRHLPTGRVAIDNHTPTSGSLTMISNRLSYVFDLHGPSMTIDTACSSSLVAVHEATQALVRGECEVALAGGVNVMLHPETFVSMCKGRFLAPDGRCKSFDAGADGYGRSEGAGMLVLKPTGAALRDGDRIYAVIRGSGANQDGRTAGITVPNPQAQQELAERVCAAAGIDPAHIGYVEAHGTGTAVGDPIELSALGAVFGTAAGRKSALPVGSLKAGIGHMEAAAGVAGVMKAALTVFHRTIAPQAWLRTLNPAIPFTELNLRVPTETEPFPADGTRALVAVNGFGYGGTNAHVLVEEAPQAHPATPRRKPARVLPISGATEAAVRAVASRLGALVAGGADDGLVCDAAWTRRAHHPVRTAVTYTDGKDLADRLAAVAAGAGALGKPVVAPGTKPVFVFSGMGPQWWRMGRDLLLAGGVFGRTAMEIDAVFNDIAGWSIVEELLCEEEHSRVEHTEVAQPANFLIQVCLVAALAELGVHPAAIVGHSVGEVSAAYVSGALSLRDALLVSYHRSRLQARTAGTGGMLAVGLTEAEAMDWLADRPDLCLAAVNSPSAITLAGPVDSLEALRVSLEETGIFGKRLRVEVPYHSALMDPILGELETVLSGVRSTEPTAALYSTVTGAQAGGTRFGAAYWRDNVREPVRFAATIGVLIEDGHRVFLEVGPHPVLSGNIREILLQAGESGTAIPTLHRKQDDADSLCRVVGALYTAGCLDGTETPGSGAGPAIHLDLPAYPWQRTRLWNEDPAVERLRTGTPDSRPLLGERLDAQAPEWETELSGSRLPWLPEHVVDGVVLLPGAAYLDAALSAADVLTDHRSLTIESVRFRKPLVVDEHDIPRLRMAIDASTNRFTVSSRSATVADWTVNCTGRIVDGLMESRKCDVPEDARQLITGEEFYARLAERGLAYGPAFRRIAEARVDADTVVATIEPPTGAVDGHLAHPTVTDAALQSVAALAELPDGAVVPAKVDAVRWFSPLPRRSVLAVARRLPGSVLRADVALCDSDGVVYVEFVGVEFARIAPPVAPIDRLDRLFYEWEWEPRETPAEDLAVVPSERETAIVVALGEPTRALAIAEAYPGSRVVAAGGIAQTIRDTLSTNGIERVTIVVVPPPVQAGSVEPAAATIDAVAGLVAAAKEVQSALDELAADSPQADAVHAVVLTERALRLPDDRHEPDLTQAALAGARRVLRNEQPGLHWRLLDVAPGHSAREVVAELRGGSTPDNADADEVALRQGVRLVPRGRRTLADRLRPYTESTVSPGPEESFELEAPASGLLTDLALRAAERRDPQDREVEVRMDVLGLNYKDAMKVLGVLTAEDLRGTYFGTGLGMEGFGQVTRVGPEVTEVSPGDQVFVSTRDMFRRYVTVSLDHGVVSPLYPGARPEHAGSLLPLFTAHYGLYRAAGVRAGDTVLVHGAAGGTGLAAIQVARALGARVIGSAGTDERRAVALAAGAHEVVNSRSLNFVDDVLRLTDGHGADVVFSSAPGETLRQNLRVAAEFGRIVEIGKADIYGSGAIDLRPFDRNLSLIAVDMDRMFQARPELTRAVTAEVLARLDKGEYEALPTTMYPVSRLPQAFESVARSRHTGRVVVDLGAAPLIRPRRPEFAVHPGATYLITGGCGAFGLATARWLVTRGATHLVLAARRGATTDEARDQLRAWASAGIDVTVAQMDVADPERVRTLVHTIRDTMPPLRGVFHTAGVLDDRLLGAVTVESLRRVVEPKVRGAWNLHTALDDAGVAVDAFVLYSSVSALVGTASQIGYAAANSALDALAALRQSQGKAALSVNWGALAGGGMAASTEEIERYLDLMGMRPIDMDTAAELLGACLSLDARTGGILVGDIDWSAWAAANPASATSTRFADQVAAAGQDVSGTDALRAELLAMPVEQRGAVLSFVLAEQLAAVLGISAEAVDMSVPLPDLGLDSLLSVELASRVVTTLGVPASALEFSRGTGISTIARRMAAGLSSDTMNLRKVS